ncbi:MAG: T9SS type A sorting domain-containing protein [Bacteroidetes bacterium]|nr:T9SS type A sorting domain-containing protein [Bacteroidota bacterium]
MHRWLLSLILFSAVLPVLAQTEEHTCKELIYHDQRFNPSKPLFKSTAGHNIDIIYDRLEFDIDPRFNEMSGVVTTYFKALGSTVSTISLDLSDTLMVNKVSTRGVDLNFSHQNNLLIITLEKPINTGQTDSVRIEYSGDPTNNIYQSYAREKSRTNDPHPIVWTISEPYGAYMWWPCKDGLTDKVDSLDMFVKIPKGNKAAGNGILVDTVSLNDSQVVYHWKHRYPIATYLVATAVTNYEEFTDVVYFKNGDTLPILNYIFPEYVPYGRNPAKETVRIMKMYDSLFGPYPFIKEKYGHAQFLRGGGMEHQTMTFMVDWNFGLVAHELAHHWFGDKVTCGSWSDLWLNEGFATYCALLSYDILLSHDDFIANNLGSRSRAFENTSLPIYVFDTLNVSRLFSSQLTYNKAAQMLHMLRWILGDDDFYSGLRAYLEDSRLAYGFARSEDLQFHLEQVSGRDLNYFFDEWLYGEAYPELTAEWQNTDGGVQVRIKQKSISPTVSFFHLPIELKVENASEIKYFRIEPQIADTTFFLPTNFVADSLFIDPNYWILTKNSVFRLDEISKGIKLIPNPATDEITVYFTNEKLKEIRVYNSVGQLISVTQVGAGSNQQTVDLNPMVPGIYMIECTGNSGRIARSEFIRQ